METTTSITIHHIYCEENIVAHWKTRFRHYIYSPVFWTCNHVYDYTFIFYNDNLGRTLVRKIV